ncbi:MAG: hypothetical protein KF777_01450, partial [Planctomycetaceae bacterium]|nr:hypothetical protein [Planctomycetaceae bacterium]
MDWYTAIERFGLPTGLLLLFIFVSWQVARFFAPLIKRLVESHLKTLRCVRRSLRVQTRLS